jgi:LSD1 subclass zinc finger protein
MLRDFLSRLFPPELVSYVPGAKLIAGAICAAVTALIGVGPETVVNLPAVGDISVSALALAIGFYLWPEKD